MRMNIKTQIKDISKRCKDNFNNMIENTHYKIDCIGTILGDKVSLATAWINDKYSNIDISKATLGYTDLIVHNNEELDELRRKELNSKK